MHCFYTSGFSTLCFLLPAMDGKIKQCVCIKFCAKHGKSATETLEMLHEASREARQQLLNGIYVSRPVVCQLKMTNIQGDQISAKR
jgi:hypothetical protein